MSFAHETKTALAAASETVKHDCCRRSMLYGILYSAGRFSYRGIKLVTSSSPLAELAIKRLSELFSVEANVYITEKKSGDADERKSNKITVVARRDLERIFEGFRYTDDDDESRIIEEMFKCPNCMQYFIRGMFMSSGTVTDPQKSYHLEMSYTSEAFAAGAAYILNLAGLEPKHMTRKNEYVVYYKDSESIENFLAFIGATAAAFTIMNTKIEKELRSDANRLANSELANIGKTVAAAGGQIAAIKALKESGELEKLSDELKITAELRLANPDASLIALASMHEPPITKSGVNHRLKKILESAGVKG